MIRRLAPLVLLTTLAACPTYDAAKYVSSDKGLMSADEFAKYGADQAVAVAVGREFGHAAGGTDAPALAKQTDAALAYAKKFASIKEIKADTAGHRLVAVFASGWHAQITPITDGKRGDETAGLPK